MRWRLALVTASFIGYFIFLHTSYYYIRIGDGFTIRISDEQTFIDRVVPGSRAAAAGFRTGDRIVTAFGLPVSHDYTFRVVNDNLPVNEPVTWPLLRNGRLIVATTAPAGRSFFNPGPVALVSGAFGTSLVLGLVLMWRRPDDPESTLAGWFLAAMGSAQ